jgi:hypothetical protein
VGTKEVAIYIYGLECPVAQTIRYVGKSVNPHARLRSHICGAAREAYNHHTARWLRTLLAEGLKPRLVILRELAPEERWQDVERDYISSAEARGWRLTNSTAGGEGLDYIDPEARAAYRAKLSASLKKVWSTPERRAQQSARARAFHSDPVNARRHADALRTAYSQPELRARVVAAVTEFNASPEVRAAKSEKAKAQWSDPCAPIRGAQQAARGKMSEAAKARYADPVKGAAARAQAATPEKRAKLAEAARRRATPEYRAMMAEKTRASWDKRRASKG